MRNLQEQEREKTMTTFMGSARWGKKWYATLRISWPLAKIAVDVSWLHIDTKPWMGEDFIIPYDTISEVRHTWLGGIRIIHTAPNVPPYLVISAPFHNKELLSLLRHRYKHLYAELAKAEKGIL